MKVVIFSAYFYPHEGGVEKYVKELFSGLKGVDVTVVACNTERSRPYEERFGFKIYRLNCKNTLGGTYPVIKQSGLKQLKVLDGKKFDYVITNTRFFNTSFVGMKFAQRNNIPLIHIEHGSCHTKLSNPISRMISIAYDHTIGRKIIKNADKVICISKAADEFVKHLYVRRTLIVHNSIDTEKFRRTTEAEQARLKKRLGIVSERIIVFVGRLIYAKGVQDLLEAAKDIDNVKVLIVGDGNYSKELKKRFTDKKYTFLGQKDIDDIIKYLSIADIFVNPSYSEGLPTSVLEAGAIGLPIIATDVGGTREIIENGKNGFLIRPGNPDDLHDKIITLLNNARTCSKFSKGIRGKVSASFDIKMSRKKIVDILKKR